MARVLSGARAAVEATASSIAGGVAINPALGGVTLLVPRVALTPGGEALAPAGPWPAHARRGEPDRHLLLGFAALASQNPATPRGRAAYLRVARRGGLLCGGFDATGDPAPESLTMWRHHARAVQAALAVTAAMRDGGDPNPADVAILEGGLTATNGTPRARAALGAWETVNKLLLLRDGAPLPVVRLAFTLRGGRLRTDVRALGPVLGLQLAALLSGAGAIATCLACGALVFAMRRRSPRRATWCERPACRKAANAAHQRAWRARARDE
jgi:hypothetical protein